jgi:hypothetical protein
MARGFESKSVADQQESKDWVRVQTGPRGDPGVIARKRRLELSRVDIVRRLEAAKLEPHRKMLEQALAALDQQLAELA